MITTELAWRLRSERGLLLAGDAKYVNPRVKEIAIRQEQLWKEFQQLDLELKQLAETDQ